MNLIEKKTKTILAVAITSVFTFTSCKLAHNGSSLKKIHVIKENKDGPDQQP